MSAESDFDKAKTFFTKCAEQLRKELVEHIGEGAEVFVGVRDCPGYPGEGFHLVVLGPGMHFDEHVWQNGYSVYDEAFFESCFRNLAQFLKEGRTEAIGIMLVRRVPPPAFVTNPHPEAMWN